MEKQMARGNHKENLENKTKGELTKARMIDGAIECIARTNSPNVTFQQIADASGEVQPLVVHYFKKKENILPLVMEEVVARIRHETDTRLQGFEKADDQLRHYIEVSIAAFRANPNVSKVLLFRYYISSVDAKTRRQVTETKNAAIDRLEKMIELGKKQKLFKEKDARGAARAIHDYLMGVLFNLVIVNSDRSDEEAASLLFDHCLRILRA
jgi:AcrR family transcriptional regulator